MLKVAVDGKPTSVPMFDQLDNVQLCLLGMNVIPTLGIKLLRSNGESLTEQPINSGNTLTVSVSLVQAETIPGRKARFLDVRASTNLSGSELLFQPNNSALAQLGLSSTDSLVTMKANGLIQLPFHNHKQENVLRTWMRVSMWVQLSS